MRKIDKKGRFVRTTKEWNPKIWNEGHFTNRKRFLVYFPKSKRAYKSGYTLRYYAVWECFTGSPVPKNRVIHHINGNRKDDRFKNLQLMTKKEHDRIHHIEQKIGKYLKCVICKKEFYKPQWRLNKGHVGKYCSKKCLYARKKNY